MQREVVEVVARLGDTIVDTAHVPRGGRYRIGCAPGVELPVAAGSLREFPIVDTGGVFRRPAGFGARVTSGGDEQLVTDGSLRLRRGMTVELALGLVVIELRLVAAPHVPVPRRPFEVRPYIYAFAALIVHLVVWAAAMLLEPFERLPAEARIEKPMHVRITEVEPPKPKDKEKPKQKAKASSAAASGGTTTESRERPTTGAGSMLGAFGDVSMLIPKVDVAKLVAEAVFYDEDAANEKLFGGGPRFDPGKKPGWGTVKSGRYATVSSGRGAGDDFDLEGAVRHRQPDIVMRPLRVAGEIRKEVVDHAVDLRIGAIGYCYQRNARKQLRGTLRIDWVIGVDGVVRGQRTSGMPEFAKCAADVIGVIPFDPSATPTVASYAFAFTPSSS